MVQHWSENRALLARELDGFATSHVQYLSCKLNQKSSVFKMWMYYFQRITFSDYFVCHGDMLQSLIHEHSCKILNITRDAKRRACSNNFSSYKTQDQVSTLIKCMFHVVVVMNCCRHGKLKTVWYPNETDTLVQDLCYKSQMISTSCFLQKNECSKCWH